jgi:FkbM family methyltransferase
MPYSLHARSYGFRIDFSNPARIWLEKGNRRLALARRDLTFVPIMDPASGIRDFVVYSGTKHSKEVETISIEDACKELGCVPSYIKMDIEGAEFSFVEGAKEFLKSHPHPLCY